MKNLLFLSALFLMSAASLAAQNPFSNGLYSYADMKVDGAKSAYYELSVKGETAELFISGDEPKYGGRATCKAKQKGEKLQIIFVSATDTWGASRTWDIASEGTVLFELKGEPTDFFTAWKALKPQYNYAETPLDGDHYFFEMVPADDPMNQFAEDFGMAEEEEVVEEEFVMEPYDEYYKGTLGGEAIYLKMTVSSDATGQSRDYEGYYYFVKEGSAKQIPLSGNLKTDTGDTEWYERDAAGNIIATFRLPLNADEWEWQSAAGKKLKLVLEASAE